MPCESVSITITVHALMVRGIGDLRDVIDFAKDIYSIIN